jgi:hypothetical protein
MKKLSNTFMVDKKDGENATSVMEKVFGGSEDENMFSNVYRIVEWKMSDWFIKNSVKQKKEDIYLYVDSIPDYFKSYTVENDKYLRICVKHKIKSDSDGYKKIKSRFMIKNFKSSYKTIINGLDLIKIINYMEITDVPNTMLVNVKIDTNISLSIPMKDDFENYLIDIFNMINENLKNKLSTS